MPGRVTPIPGAEEHDKLPEYGPKLQPYRTVVSRERIGRLLKMNTEHDCEVSRFKFRVTSSNRRCQQSGRGH